MTSIMDRIRDDTYHVFLPTTSSGKDNDHVIQYTILKWHGPLDKRRNPAIHTHLEKLLQKSLSLQSTNPCIQISSPGAWIKSAEHKESLLLCALSENEMIYFETATQKEYNDKDKSKKGVVYRDVVFKTIMKRSVDASTYAIVNSYFLEADKNCFYATFNVRNKTDATKRSCIFHSLFLHT